MIKISVLATKKLKDDTFTPIFSLAIFKFWNNFHSFLWKKKEVEGGWKSWKEGSLWPSFQLLVLLTESDR